MARIEWVKHKLDNWALWAAREKGGGLGFASQSVLLSDGGGDPDRQSRVPVDEIEAAITDQAVSSLAARGHQDLQKTIVMYHIDGLSIVGLAKALSLGESSVHSRLGSADRLLAIWFTARSERMTASIVCPPRAPLSLGPIKRGPKRSFTS